MFERLATWVSEKAGSPWAFCLALAVVVFWAISGPLFGFSETWQLVINTGTTIVTFLMVFLLQATQTRDTNEIKRDIKDSKVMIVDLVKSIPEANTELAEEIEGEHDQ